MEFTLIKLRQIVKDSENGIDQMVSLIPQFPIEVINEYWNSVWLQEPANPDDRWKSDWIRAILIAYSNDGSQPATFRDGNNIKRSSRERVSTWTEDEKTLSINDEWSHISVNILNTIIRRLNIQVLRFSGFSGNHQTAKIFTKWIENPCPIIHLVIYIENDKINSSDFFLKLENNISNEIKSLSIWLRSEYGRKENYFKIGSTFLSRFKNLEIFKLESNLEKNQCIDFSNNKNLLELDLCFKVYNDGYCTLSGLGQCIHLSKIKAQNSLLSDFKFENKTSIKELNFNKIKIKENLIGTFKGEEIRITNSEIGDIINVEYVNKLNERGRYSNEIILENSPTLKKLLLKGFISDLKLEKLDNLEEININCFDSIRKINISKFYNDFKSAHIKCESIREITIANCKQKSLPIIRSNSLFKNDSKSGTNILIYNHETKTLDGIEGISNIKKIELYGLNKIEKFFNSTSTSVNILEKVKIENSSLKNLDNVSCFQNLRSLYLISLTHLENLQGVSVLAQLEKLDLSGCNMVATLEPLLDLPNLNELKLSSCDALKPKPKKVFLSGFELKKELLRYSKDKSLKNQFDTSHLDKFISLVKSFNPEDILQACTLMDLFDEKTIEQIFFGISYNKEKQSILLPSLPKNIQENECEITILALKILIESKRLANYSNILESINQINIGKSEINNELNKLLIENYELFRSLFKNLGELNDLINLKIINVNALENIDLTGIYKLEKMEKVHIINVKTFSNIDDLLKCNSLKELNISGTNEKIVDFGSNNFNLVKLKLNGSFSNLINYNNIFCLEELEIQSQNKLDLLFNENLKKLKKIKLIGQFGSIDGINSLSSLEELIMPLAKIDDPETLFNAIHTKKVKKYSLGIFSF